MDRNDERCPCAVAPPHVKRNGEFVMNAKRVVLRIQLDQSAKEHLDRLSRTLGMMQISIMSRLTEWVTRQHQIIQYTALGVLTPKLGAPLAKELLEELSGQQQAASRG